MLLAALTESVTCVCGTASPNKAQTWLSIWAVVGPLVGVMLGSYLSTRGQRKHWIADNKKEEFRELLSVLTKAYSDITTYQIPMVAHGPEEQRAYTETQKRAGNVIFDRIFIASEVKKIGLMTKWQDSVGEVERTKDVDQFALRFGAIVKDITSAAEKIID